MLRSILFFALTIFSLQLMAQTYDADWKRMEQFQREGKTRSALKLAEDIYAKADADGQTDQQLKALYHRVSYLQSLEDFNSESHIELLRQVIATEKDPAFLALAEHVLGRYLYSFGNSNASRLSDRTTETDFKIDWDIPLTEWSLNALFSTGTDYLLSSVERGRQSKQALSKLPAVVQMGENMADRIPTLYDALVHATLDQLSSGYAYLPEPVYVFSPGAELLLQPLDGFLRARVKTQDTEGLNYRTFNLYQQLLGEQLRENQQSALVFTNLKRLQWGYQLSGDDEAYNQALKDFYTTASSYPGAGSILLTRANHLAAHPELETNGDKTQERFSITRSLTLLEEIISRFPNTEAAQYAEDRINGLKQPILRVATEDYLQPNSVNLIGLTYQNIDKLYYKVYRNTFSAVPNNQRIQQSDIKQMARTKALISGTLELAENDDYQQHTTEFILASLPSGQYSLIVSADADFDHEQGITAHKRIAVSNLALLHLEGEESNRGLVVDRQTGVAVAGVSVSLYLKYGYRNDALGEPTLRTSDVNGYIDLPEIDQRRYRSIVTVLEKGNDRSSQQLNVGRYRDYSRANKDTKLFLDRGIYRPGQTVYLKGITVNYNKASVASLVKNQSVNISLRDANGQEVATKPAVSDDFGAFSLEFVLPEGGLNGRFSLYSDFGGSQSFRVEAYKRPRFEVTFDEMTEAVESGQEVTVTGHAIGFAGPPVAGGKVTYRVVRETVSYWYFYRGGGSGEPEAVLATGTTTTDDDGNFDITFEAKTPNNGKLPYWRRPHYVFKVYADVADITGETHAGNTSIQLRKKGATVALDVPELLDRAGEREQVVTIKYEAPANLTNTQVATINFQAIRHPDPATVNRYWQIPDRPIINRQEFNARFPNFAYSELRDKDEWPLQRGITLPYTGRQLTLGEKDTFNFFLDAFPVGHYRITVSYPDGEGGEATTLAHFSVFDSTTGQLPSGKAYLLDGGNKPVMPGASVKLNFLVNESLPLVISDWQSRGTKQQPQSAAVDRMKEFSYQVEDKDRGGIHFHLNYVRHNRFFSFDRRISVPWPSKQLQLEYTTFRDKLRPGVEEEWSILVKDHQGNPISAQLLASMYDASLDAISPYSWSGLTSFFPNGFSRPFPLTTQNFGSGTGYGQLMYNNARKRTRYQLPSLNFSPIRFDQGRFRTYSAPMAMQMDASMEMAEQEPEMKRSSPPPPPAPAGNFPTRDVNAIAATTAGMSTEDDDAGAEQEIQIRKNLQETAFFQPHIRVDQDGVARISFTTPEALTKWKLQVLAHTPELAYAYETKEVVTQKELMILPNAPRFMREGDAFVFTAKVSNLSDQQMNGQAKLEFFNPETEEVLISKVAKLVNKPSTDFQLEAGKSQSVEWKVTVPAEMAGLIGYRVTARSGNFSDGEQNVLPILTNRVFLTATKSFFLRPNQKETFSLDALLNSTSAAGDVVNKGYRFEMTNNPSWLAVKSLPYLTEYPYDCTEQIVNRFFANQLSAHIVKDKPELQKVYAEWKEDPDALTSPLALNQDVKQALLEETPWISEAADESQQMERMATLFDLKRIAKEQEATLVKLEERQRADGSFSWFPDGPVNAYMTQYVVESLQRLTTLGALNDNQQDRVKAISTKTLNSLDSYWNERYRKLMERSKKDGLNAYRPATLLIHYLYIRSYFIQEQPLNKESRKTWDFYYGQAKKHWADYGLYDQALLANTYARTEPQMGKLIIESLRERALRSEEFGMNWKYPQGWGWQQLPIETHCRIFEAFLLNGGTQMELDEMRLYLLQNKRTNRWETTKATAAAVHALLLNGTEWTNDDRKATVSIPGITATTLSEAANKAEVGTGYYQVQIPAASVQPKMGKVTVNNDKPTIAWGGLYWQFTQDIDAVQKQNEDGPLGLTRKIFRRINTDAGERLVEVNAQNSPSPGDRLVVQLTVRSDRDFEYVHLKDRRASGLEPTEQLSGYRYRGGLGFYFSPDDLAVNFFFDYLPKGTHTLEYDLFVNHKGDFSNGLSVLQSMYAPEFAGYSEGSRLIVR